MVNAQECRRQAAVCRAEARVTESIGARACSAQADSVGFPGRSGWQILSALIRFWERERCRRPTLLIFEVE